MELERAGQHLNPLSLVPVQSTEIFQGLCERQALTSCGGLSWEAMTDWSGHQLSRKQIFFLLSPEKFVHKYEGLVVLLYEL